MKTSLRLASLLFAAAAAVPVLAQTSTYSGAAAFPLSVGMLGSESLPSGFSNWQTNIAETLDQNAALQFNKDPQATSLLLVHVLPDPRHPNHANLLSTWQAMYPFLHVPAASWTVSHSTLQSANYAFDNSLAAQLLIPPDRLIAIVAELEAKNFASAEFGPTGGSGGLAVFNMPATVVTSNALGDRWYHSAWNASRDTFNIANMARRALDMSARKYYQKTGMNQSLDLLESVLSSSFRWQIQMQVIRVKPPTGGRINLAVSNPVMVKRLSLGTSNEDEWLQKVGPTMVLPFLPTGDLISTGIPTRITEVNLLSEVRIPSMSSPTSRPSMAGSLCQGSPRSVPTTCCRIHMVACALFSCFLKVPFLASATCRAPLSWASHRSGSRS